MAKLTSAPLQSSSPGYLARLRQIRFLLKLTNLHNDDDDV
jgi:hypothetical protein